MTFETIRIERDARGVATITLNRPEKHNALNALMIHELTNAAIRLSAEKQIRAVVLAAEGPSFCAGGDLNWMRDQATKDRSGKMAEARALATMLQTLNEIPKPFDATFALKCGLVSSVAGQGELDAMVESEIAFILKTKPGAVASAKALCFSLGGDALSDQFEITAAALADRWETEEAQEGISAFLSKA